MKTFFALCVSIFNLVFRGFVIKVFWKWFVLTKFSNLPVLETIEAIGLVYFISSFRLNGNLFSVSEIDDNKELSKEDKLVARQVLITVLILFAFVSGWIIHLLM